MMCDHTTKLQQDDSKREWILSNCEIKEIRGKRINVSPGVWRDIQPKVTYKIYNKKGSFDKTAPDKLGGAPRDENIITSSYKLIVAPLGTFSGPRIDRFMHSIRFRLRYMGECRRRAARVILKNYLKQRQSLAKLRKIRLNLLSIKIQRAWRLSDPDTRRRNRNKTKQTHESKLRYRSLIPKSCFSTTTVEMPSLARTVVCKDSDYAPSYRHYIPGINWDERCPNCNKFFITKIGMGEFDAFDMIDRAKCGNCGHLGPRRG